MSTTVYHAIHPERGPEAKTTAAPIAEGLSKAGWRVTAVTEAAPAKPLAFDSEDQV